ncbi:DUF4124 domain-containing protein [Rhodanobacter sp. AS-Z3]|uniref:DUF4124 domain-containing protein n=1 Tax=Rhodanobacter sp. AS-Z3 TaxID=3031330 RepID=UPI00247B1B4F|nr:DUF4124 domain-containing protein [Rhodanobacter sp. AS-Z3]WEN14364.1 DUF4124 domain-containing protein [Rhodanobacter sp. AS-Z3]
MKVRPNRIRLSCIAVLLLTAAGCAGAQNIYKCTSAAGVSYTDRPCPKGQGELLHQADDTEVIDRYLRLGQDNLAKSYADSHHLEALYQQRIEVRQQTQDEKAQRQADEAYATQIRDEQAQQQAQRDEAAERNRLQGENEALREQNAAYQDQLTQEASRPAPAYFAPYPNRRPRRDHHHDGDGGHDHEPPSTEPIFHPCKQLAGGRTQC